MNKKNNEIISKARADFYNIVEPIYLEEARKRKSKEYDIVDTNPFISVYVPTYNRSSLLVNRAIKSVLAQTYTNFEFIIVGDSCTDDTEEIVKNINDTRIKFYNIPVRDYRYPPTSKNHWFAGPVVASNIALDMVSSKSKWIARIDDDDIWTNDHLKKLLDYALKNNYEFVSSYSYEIRYGKEIINKGDFLDKNEKVKIGGTQTWLYRSYLKFFKYNIDCWRKSWNKVNDTDLQDRMYKAGVNMGFLKEVTCKIIPRPNEKTIGLEAYELTSDEKLKHFKF